MFKTLLVAGALGTMAVATLAVAGDTLEATTVQRVTVSCEPRTRDVERVAKEICSLIPKSASMARVVRSGGDVNVSVTKRRNGIEVIAGSPKIPATQEVTIGDPPDNDEIQLAATEVAMFIKTNFK